MDPTWAICAACPCSNPSSGQNSHRCKGRPKIQVLVSRRSAHHSQSLQLPKPVDACQQRTPCEDLLVLSKIRTNRGCKTGSAGYQHIVGLNIGSSISGSGFRVCYSECWTRDRLAFHVANPLSSARSIWVTGSHSGGSPHQRVASITTDGSFLKLSNSRVRDNGIGNGEGRTNHSITRRGSTPGTGPRSVSNTVTRHLTGAGLSGGLITRSTSHKHSWIFHMSSSISDIISALHKQSWTRLGNTVTQVTGPFITTSISNTCTIK